MKAYWIVFAIMFLLQFIKVNTQKQYLFRLIISFIPLFIYAAYRVNFGYDYEAYQEIFNTLQRYPGQYDDFRTEIGYLKLNECLPTFRSLLIITSLLTCAAYTFFFYNVIPARYAWLAILLLFLAGDKAIFFMFSGIRNSISISILIFSLPLLKKRKLLLFVLCMILASYFHKTAFIYFPLAYIVCNNKDMTYFEMMVWCGVFAFFFIFSHTMLMRYISYFTDMLFYDRYDTYIESIYKLGDNRGILLRIAMLVLFVPLIWYTYKGKFSTQGNTILRLGLMYVLSLAMGTLNMRTSQHFIIFFIAAVVFVFSHSERNKIMKNGYALFVIAYLLYAFFVYMGNPAFPYDVYESTIFGLVY